MTVGPESPEVIPRMSPETTDGNQEQESIGRQDREASWPGEKGEDVWLTRCLVCGGPAVLGRNSDVKNPLLSALHPWSLVTSVGLLIDMQYRGAGDSAAIPVAVR